MYGSRLEALQNARHTLSQQQAALAEVRSRWLAQAEAGAVVHELAAYDRGTAYLALPCLSLVLGKPARADALIDPLLKGMGLALRDARFGLVPFRHQSTSHHDVLELARVGSAALSLMAYRPRTRNEAASASFSSGERHELCLRGRAAGREVTLSDDPNATLTLTCSSLDITRGWSARYDNARRTKVIEQVTEPLVVLRLARDATPANPAREYRIPDGALLHQSAADRRDSRSEIALAVLGSMKRRDALPAMAQMARSGPPHVRWEALRQTLALDTAKGFRLLCALAEDARDPLHAPAAALRAQLLQAHPSLAHVNEEALCPA